MSRVNDALLATLRARLGSGLTVEPRAPLEHQSNSLYDAWLDGRHLIVKEYLKIEEFEIAPRAEFDGLRVVAALDIAPRPVLRLPVGAGHGPIVVYAYLEGEMWDRRKPSPAELKQLADIWLRMHALPTDGLWYPRNHHLSLADHLARWQQSLTDYQAWAEVKCPEAVPQARACLALLAARQPQFQRLAEMTAVLAFCRSDARFANVISRPDGRLGLIDWEDSGLRDPAVDLADLLTHANNEDLLSPDEWQAFLTPYLEGRAEIDPGLRERQRLYLAVFPVFWLAALSGWVIRLSQEDRLEGWQLNTMPANERLKRWLARGQAWPRDAFEDELRALEGARFF